MSWINSLNIEFDIKLSYTILWCIPIWLMLYWHGEDRDVRLLLRSSVLTGEHANYSQINYNHRILTFHSIYDYFALIKQIPLLFFNISKTNYLLINHLICTIPDTEQIVILILHFSIIQKLKYVIYTKIFLWGKFHRYDYIKKTN